MKKLKEKRLKDNQEAQMTLKEFIEYFQQDLNDPASTLMAIEETMHIIKEEHNTETNISVGGIDKFAIMNHKGVSLNGDANHLHHIGHFRI